MNERDREIIETAASAFGFLAADFVTQPETWPVFRAWCQQHGPMMAERPEDVLPLVAILNWRH